MREGVDVKRSSMRARAAEFGVKEGSKLAPVEDIFHVPLDQIVPDPNQPRRAPSKEGLEELKESILKNGLEQPIEVRRKERGFMVVWGERRYIACKELGFTKIPAKIVEATDKESLIRQLNENLQREDLSLLDQAHSYQRLRDEFGYTDARIGEMVGKSKPNITNKRRLLNLPRWIQKKLALGQLSEGHARVLLTVGLDNNMQEQIVKAIEGGLNVRGAERLAKDLRTKKAEKVPRETLPTSTWAQKLEPTCKGDKVVKKFYETRFVRLQEDVGDSTRQVSDRIGKLERFFELENELMERINLDRGLMMLSNCVHRVGGFCVFWRWEDKPSFSDLMDELNPVKNKTRPLDMIKMVVPKKDSPFWVLAARAGYCRGCSAYKPDPSKI